MRNKYSISRNTFVFLYLGRINKDKGIDDLINVFNRIDKRLNVMLIFLLEQLKKKNIFINLKIKKIFYILTIQKNLNNGFSLADILCLPSYREGFGTVIIEAAACGIPTLCSKIYGLKDAIDEHKTGFFHKVGSLSDIERKILYILKNKKLIKKYGSSARKRVINNFDQNILSKNLLKFINSIIVKMRITKSIKKKNVLVYGAGEAGRQLVNSLENNTEFNVVGFIDDNKKLTNKFLLNKNFFSLICKSRLFQKK